MNHRFTLAMAAAILTGCGGSVVVDSGGGAGGDSVSESDPCPAYCSQHGATCGEGAFSCEEACPAVLANAGKCRDLFAKAFGCFADRLAEDGCHPEGCVADMNEAYACVTPAGPCSDGVSCPIVDGTCAATCGGVEYVADCPMKEFDGPGTGTLCTCRVDGQVVGECAATLIDPFIWSGCCAQIFAETE